MRLIIVNAPRQVAAHQGAAAGHRFNLHPAVMQFQETVDQGKTQPGARAVARLTLGGEAFEHRGLHFWRQAGAIVGHRDLYVFAHDPGRKRDDATVLVFAP